MPCSNCGQSGHNILTCKNEKVSKINLKCQKKKKKKKKKKKEEEKFQGEMNIDHIKAFTARNTKAKNDETNKIRSSVGVGANVYTQVGPLTFVLAQDLTSASTDETERFNFRLGTSF